MRSPEQRAQRLLRWYPRTWRERHHAEFAALLEDSMTERSFWPRRTVDVVIHGMRARLIGFDPKALVRRSNAATIVVVAGLVALGMGVGASRSDGQWAPGINLEVFMQSNASAAQIAAVRDQVATSRTIRHCSYLDHEDSYRRMKRLFASQPELVGVLTPATTPPVFACTLVDPARAPTVAAMFPRGESGIYQAEYPARSVLAEITAAEVLQFTLYGLAGLVLIAASGFRLATRERHNL